MVGCRPCQNKGMSPATRNTIWQGLLDLDRLVRYYSLLSTRYHRRQQGIRTVILLATMAGVAGLATPVPFWVAPVSVTAVALAVLFESFDRTGERATVSDILVYRYRKAMSDWTALWDATDAGLLSEPEVLQRKHELMTRIQETMGDLDERLRLGAFGDSRLNEKAAEDAYAVLERQYAAA